jgi:acyl carrier protein
MSPPPQALQHATREQIFARVAELLSEAFDLSPEQVRLDSHLIDDLDLDSIDAIDLVVGLEEETGLDVSESELRTIRVVGDIVDLVHGKLAGSGRPG